MDEETINKLAEAAKRVVRIKYEFPGSQNPSHPILTRIHQYYIDWDDPELRPDFTRGYDEADFTSAEKAIKKFKIDLRDCGSVGEKVRKITFASLENASYWISEHKKFMEDHRKWQKEKGIEMPWAKTQNRGNQRLRVYIIQMVCWYKEFVGKKPHGGTSSIFPKLIRKCLAVVDEDRVGKGAPDKPIRRVLEELDKPHFWDHLQQHWRDHHKGIFAIAEKGALNAK